MCLTVFLLSDLPLPVPPDEVAYPGLKLHAVGAEYQSQTLASIRHVLSAAFVYDVSPAGYCGCYFGYETTQEFEADMADRATNPDMIYASTPEQHETMWRSRTDAVKSFGRYLAAHLEARLAVYSVWESCVGQKAPVRAEVPPSYFGGPGFEQLPEDIRLTVVPETAVGGDRPWNPSARRTHEWLGCGSDCSQTLPDALTEENLQ